MKRRNITLTDQVAILQRQAVCACGCCRSLKGQRVEYHHMHEIGLGGPDHVENLAAVLADCHRRLTSGTKATSAGSSQSRIAKAKRLEAARLALAGAEARTVTAPAFLTQKFADAVNARPVTGAPLRIAQLVDEYGYQETHAAEVAASAAGLLIPKGVKRKGSIPSRPMSRKPKRGKR